MIFRCVFLTADPSYCSPASRPVVVPAVMVKQMEADRAQGYDYVAYHGYGKRRYFELVGRKYRRAIQYCCCWQ
jgi:hypothetical protein